MGLRKYKSAIGYFDNSIKLKPDHLEAWINKAESYFRLNKQAEMDYCLAKVIQLEPRYKIVINSFSLVIEVAKHLSLDWVRTVLILQDERVLSQLKLKSKEELKCILVQNTIKVKI